MGAFCSTLDLHLRIIVFGLLLSGCLRQVLLFINFVSQPHDQYINDDNNNIQIKSFSASCALHLGLIYLVNVLHGWCMMSLN